MYSVKETPMMRADSARPDAATLRKWDSDHFMHPFTDFKSLAEAGGARIIERAEGIWLYDSDGQKMLDGMAGLWCVAVGYGRQELVDAATRQMQELPYYNCFFKTTTPPPAQLARKLAEITPKSLNHVMYASSGSEANDTIVRMVRHFWNLEGKPSKKTIIGRIHGYHGSTMTATSLCGMKPMHEQGDLPFPGFVHVTPPYWYGFGGDLSPEEFGIKAARAVEEKILELGPDNVAAFIGEPVQGAGGVIIPPDSYWPEINRICKQYDILLIADEVITGFGRLGAWTGSEHYKINADFITMAKCITSGYLPLSAVMVGDRVAKTFYEKGEEFYHGFTYSGHPVACAVGLENLNIIERENMIPRIRDDIGPYLGRRLKEEFTDHPIIGEVRSLGLIAALEIVKDKKTREFYPKPGTVGLMCRDHCFRNNLVMRAVRDTMVLAPPFVITHDEVEELIRRARIAFDATAKDLGVM